MLHYFKFCDSQDFCTLLRKYIFHIISDVAFNYAMSELPGIGIFGVSEAVYTIVPILREKVSQ